MAATISEKGFDYDRMKIRYMELINKVLLLNPKSKELKAHSTELIKSSIAEIKRNKEFDQPNADFDVVFKDGADILVKKRLRSEIGAQVLSFDDIYDCFMKKHVKDFHAPVEKLIELAELKRYIAPAVFLDLIIKACDVCNKPYTAEIIDKSLSSKKGKVSEMYIVPIVHSGAEKKSVYLLIYVDVATNYTILRPMIAKEDKEIALTLFQIFTQFGPPEVVFLRGYNPSCPQNINSILKTLCPMFRCEVVHKRMKYDLPTTIVELLEDWKANSKSEFWELGCSIVQMRINNQYERNTIKDKVCSKPKELYFTEFLKKKGKKT